MRTITRWLRRWAAYREELRQYSRDLDRIRGRVALRTLADDVLSGRPVELGPVRRSIELRPVDRPVPAPPLYDWQRDELATLDHGD